MDRQSESLSSKKENAHRTAHMAIQRSQDKCFGISLGVTYSEYISWHVANTISPSSALQLKNSFLPPVLGHPPIMKQYDWKSIMISLYLQVAFTMTGADTCLILSWNTIITRKLSKTLARCQRSKLKQLSVWSSLMTTPSGASSS